MLVRLGTFLLLSLSALLVGEKTADANSPNSAVECEKQPGFIQGPVVPTKDIAKAIYIAVARTPYLHKLEGRGPVTVVDEGAAWGVLHYLEPKVTRGHQGDIETVTVVTGGGKLEMLIDKCTGAVSMSLGR